MEPEGSFKDILSHNVLRPGGMDLPNKREETNMMLL